MKQDIINKILLGKLTKQAKAPFCAGRPCEGSVA